MTQTQCADTMINFTPLASAPLLLPANLILAAALGLLLRQRWPGAIRLTWVALVLLWLLSTRLGASLLITPLEQQNPALAKLPPGIQAIVVLGGGRRSNAPEYGNQDGPSNPTLTRLQYAARLQHASGLPILVSGGRPDGSLASEAEIMARSLHEDFDARAQWQETQSATTAENAILSVQILHQANVHKIVLVTDAIHMPRALASFRAADPSLSVTAAPTAFSSSQRCILTDFLPTAQGLQRINYALHEWLGMLWYKIRP